MRILVGFDDSEGAWDAIALVRVFCGLTDAEALVVQVLSERQQLPVPYRVTDLERYPDPRTALELAREALAGIEVSTRSYTGDSPAHVLHDLAENEGVEAMVIGSPRHGAFGRTFYGSIGEALLHGASRPLLVAPRGYASQAHEAPRVIAIAYDGTTESKLALRHAEALAAAAGATIRVLTVAMPAVPVPAAIGYAPPPLGFEPEKLIEEALAAIHSVEAEGRRLVGPAAAALAEACEEDVDLLVAGSRGYGPLGRVFAGSVTSSLICRAPCPVLVVPRSGGKAPESSQTATETREEEVANS